MVKKNSRIRQEALEIERIEDLFFAFLETPDNRICPICKRHVSEWGDDWLPTNFETCGLHWDEYRENQFKNQNQEEFTL